MKRPYVICHMLTSINGKIDGTFMSASESTPALVEYSNLRNSFNCEATLYGTTTMLGGFSDGYAGELVHDNTECSYEDYIAPSDVKNYIISIDPKGILGYNSCYIEKKNRPKAYVIEALTELASNDYTAYLRNIGISYVFAGKEQINFSVLLEKLYKLFSIKRILAAGGGLTNWSLAQENLIDELSIVIAPTADGNTNSVTIFEKSDFLPDRKPVEFRLKNIKQIDNAVHLLYEAKR